MAVPKGGKDGLFTYKDYLTWPEEERWELIHGVAYNMSPAPNRRHQGLVTYLAGQFVLYFDDHPCHAYVSPFDVLLEESEDDADTVVQPDLVVICDSTKLTEQGCTGAPDFVLEILSPSTAFKDMEEKLRLYESSGVREYWILNPGNDTLLVYSVVPEGPAGSVASSKEADDAGAPAPQHKSSFCKPVLFTREDTVAPRIFPDLKINLERVFDRE